MVALCQCSGNRRGLFQPHVAGVEWGYGAMGCARWKGVRLKDLLDKAGLKKEAIEIVLDGADRAVSDKTPDFVKSIPVCEGDRGHDPGRLRDERAAAAALQRLSGASHRSGLDRHLLGEAPDLDQGGDQAVRGLLDEGRPTAFRSESSRSVARFTSQETAVNTPITEMVVNSLITSHADGAMVKVGRHGHARRHRLGRRLRRQLVEVSTDGGKTWTAATLGKDLGPFALRVLEPHFAAQGGRASNGHGARHQQDRPEPGHRV